MRIISTTLLASSLLVLTACNSTGGYKSSGNVSSLDVSFADSNWNGKTIPENQICAEYGGNGSSPKLVVKGIPKEANAVVVEFNDQDYQPLSYDGGHGAIWIATGGKSSVTVPSVKSQSDNLPQGVNVESSHRSGKYAGGVYLAPCSGGRNNLYYADVKAVFKASDKTQESKLFATGKIVLGKY